MTDRGYQSHCDECTPQYPVTIQSCNDVETQQIIAGDSSLENVNPNFYSRDYYFTLSTIMTFLCCVSGGFLSTILSIAAMLVSLSAKEYYLSGDKKCAEKKGRIALFLNILAILLAIIVDIIIIDVTLIYTHSEE